MIVIKLLFHIPTGFPALLGFSILVDTVRVASSKGECCGITHRPTCSVDIKSFRDPTSTSWPSRREKLNGALPPDPYPIVRLPYGGRGGSTLPGEAAGWKYGASR